MTTQLLATELANLVHESKRKNNDLRQVSHAFDSGTRDTEANALVKAAEKSLEELKGLRVTTEPQVAAGRCI